MRLCALGFVLASASAAAAPLPLELPLGASLVHQTVEDPESYALPVAPFGPTATPTETVEGQVTTRVWRTPSDRADTLATFRALRDQVEAAGYRLVLECSTRACGGFDFRVGTEIQPPPIMGFSLGDFRFLSARDGARAISLLVSRTQNAGFVQAIEVEPGGEGPALAPAEDARPGSLVTTLARDGRAVLEGVRFDAGAAEPRTAEVLAPLAEMLREQPDMQVILVGHTDSQGSVEANLALSRARADAIRRALIDLYGVSPDRIAAHGVGSLVPIASNDTDEGRSVNRRVEVVLP